MRPLAGRIGTVLVTLAGVVYLGTAGILVLVIALDL